MKKTIRLTESDLTRIVKRITNEKKTKSKLNESNEHLRDEMEDLMAEVSTILNNMYDLVKRANDLHDKVHFDIEDEDDDVSQSVGILRYYSDLFYDLLKDSNNI